MPVRSPDTRGQRLRRVLRHPGFWAPFAVLTAVGLLVLLLGPIAWWATPAKHLTGKDKADARNATRQVLLAGVGGLVLLTGAGFTARTYYLTRRGQLTDRYTKAIGQLASDKLTERLGGIYALEHLMAESERDHGTVVEVLAAFIREQTRTVESHEPEVSPVTDVQAAVTVLGRRPRRGEAHPVDLTGARLFEANLQNTQLAGATLVDIQLVGAFLSHADLQQARLYDAVLDGAFLNGAQLHRAILKRAHLRHTILSRAHLPGADLTHAELQEARLDDADLQDATLSGARLHGAILTGARLERADLRTAEGITAAQLRAARWDSSTLFPEDIASELGRRSARLPQAPHRGHEDDNP